VYNCYIMQVNIQVKYTCKVYMHKKFFDLCKQA